MTQNIPLAFAYYMNGSNFRMSAEKLKEGLALRDDGSPKLLTAIPLYFLASQAAELFLKAALLKRGATPKSLKEFDKRHNLDGLLMELLGNGLVVTENTQMVIKGLSEQHNKHILRYNSLVELESPLYWPNLDNVFLALDELFSLCMISTQGF